MHANPNLPLNPVGDHEKWRWASRWMICGNSVEERQAGGRRDAPSRWFVTVCLRAVHYARSDSGCRADERPWVRSSMLYHRAYGRDLDTLVVAVIDNRRPMLSLMRGMLAAIGIGRIETYESPIDAFDAMSRAVPDLVIAASSMQPLSGAALVKVMRHALSGPLSLVPAMIMSTRARPALVEESLRAGAHQVLVLPISAST